MRIHKYLHLSLITVPMISAQQSSRPLMNSTHKTMPIPLPPVNVYPHIHNEGPHILVPDYAFNHNSDDSFHELLTTFPTSPVEDLNNYQNVTHRHSTPKYPTPDSGFHLRDDQWIAPVMALAGLNMIVIFAFEMFVLYKACRTSPSRRHLFLGQMLLLGLFLSSALGVAFVPNPTWWSCSVIRAGLGLSYCIILGTLLVKTVFLISLHSGIYLPAEYQALLLFFIIITQVAIDIQWLINHSSSIVIDHMDPFGTVIYRCDHSLSSILMSLIYVVCLIVMVSFLALKAKNHRENHGEARFIAMTIITCIVLWCVWIAGAVTSGSSKDRDAFMAFGVVGNATVVFLIMFLPKGRQLAAMGRESGGHDDRDALSSPSSPSVYTPSFLHIKPSFIPLNNKNGNIYKQFGSGTDGSGGHYGSGGGRHPVKSMVNDRFYYLPPPPGGPPPPPPGHRVWRSGCYPSPGYGNPHLSHNHLSSEEYFYPYEPQTRQMHPNVNPNVKFYRAPCY